MSDDTLVAGSELVFFDAGIGTWSWNEGDGVFTLSPDALRLLQVHSDELPLRFDTILEAVDADDRAALSAAFGRMVEDLGTHSAVFRARLDSGESRWFRAVGRALRSESGAAVTAAGVLLDVTAEHRAETFRDTFFEQPNGLHLVAAVDGTIELVNSGWEVILGHRPDTLVGSSFLELVHPDDREATLAEMANLGMGLTTHYFENRYRAADGDYRLIAWSAAVPAGDSSIFAVGTDITEKDAARRRLQEATVVFRSSGEAIVITDADGVIKEVNDAFTKITGYEREEAVGQHTRLLRSGRHDKAFYEALWSALQGEGQWRGEIWNRRKNGEVYPELLTITRIDGDGSGYVAMFTDISNIKQTEQRLQRLAHYDPLTELPNRYLINERLEQSLRRAQRSDYRLAVLFLDVDGFKNVNDSLGHQAGDTLLTETAARLRGALRDMDNVGRIGGDEFLVVLEDIESADGATIVAEKILGALREPLRLNGRAVTITASIGISIVSRRRRHGRGTDEQRGRGDVQRQGAGPRHVPLLLRAPDQSCLSACTPGFRAARGDTPGRAPARVPAPGGPRRHAHDRAGSAAALEPSAARRRAAGAVHTPRRAHGFDPRLRPVGTGCRLPPGRGLAGRGP
jgi:diguanylate cyclase (GGDEF)-like protein/PAS domain S-box-containing protein